MKTSFLRVRYTRKDSRHWLLTFSLILVGLGYHQTQAWANTTQSLKFATPVTKSALWDEEKYGTFSPATVLQLTLDETTVMFYHDNRSWERSVYAFTHGQRQTIWKGKEWEPYPSGQIPAPLLASGYLNRNQTPDLLLCVSYDRGIGRGTEHWNQELFVLFDYESSMTESIPLTKMDIRVCNEDEEKEGCKTVKNTEDALVMILPASEEENFTLVVWSRLNHCKGSILFDDYYKCSCLYRVSTYTRHDKQLHAVERIEGDYQQTSVLLHTMIQKRRAQEKAPAPILLNFLWELPYTLCDDEEKWFGILD